MRPPGAKGKVSERGQASVEFLGILPATLLAALTAWQLALAGQAAWLTANAARVGARADAVGRDPKAAVRSALPSHYRRQLVVRTGDGGKVSVRVRLPMPLVRSSHPLSLGASARLERP